MHSYFFVFILEEFETEIEIDTSREKTQAGTKTSKDCWHFFLPFITPSRTFWRI